jgi:hypothetical protein
MITYASLGGAAMEMQNGKKTLRIFPEKGAMKGADFALLSRPEEGEDDTVISWPGEYDIDGVSIRGIGHDGGKQVSYVIECDDIRGAFISSPLHEWNDNELELLGDVDVLCIPADDVKLAQKLIDEIDPRVLIPLPTKDKGTFDDLLKNVGAKGAETVNDYKIKSKSGLPAEGRDLVVLKAGK